MKRLSRGRYLLLWLALSLLCGCSAPEDRPADGAPSSPDSSAEPEAVYDLLTEKWAQEKTDAEPAAWNVASCLEAAVPDPTDADYSFYYSAAEGSCHYLLTKQVTVRTDPDTMLQVQSGQSLWLSRTDVDSGESVMKELSLTAASGTSLTEAGEAFLQAYENHQASITGMDVSSGSLYLFFQQSDPDSPKTIHYYRVQTDLEGHIEEVLDLFPALQAGGILPEDRTELPGGRCDSAGLCYLGDISGSRICVIDREGNLITSLESSGKPLTYIGKLPEGAPLYVCLDFQAQRLSILSFDGQECRELYRGTPDSLQQCMIRPNGDLFYGKGDKLFRWNVIKGTCEQIYAGAEFHFTDCEGIVCASSGRPYAVFRQGDGTFLYEFTDENIETTTIHVEQIGFLTDEYLQKCASAYTSRHPGVVIDVTAPEAEPDMDTQLSRLVTRLSQDQGPDLILIPASQLPLLQGNDALADLTDILPAEEKEQFFPGMLEAGQIGGRLYGLASSASFSTLIVSDQVWPGESWTLSDILEIIREREQSGDPLEYFEAPGRYAESSNDYWSLFLLDIAHSSLLNLQEGTCCFDSEEFRRTLEFCKKSYENSRSLKAGSSEPAELVLAGKALVCGVYGDLMEFSRILSALGEGYHAVGFPTVHGDSGHLMEVSYEHFLTVNARAEHREIIDDFLRFYVSYQAQKQYAFSWIRTDVLKNCVREGVTSYGYPTPIPVFHQGDRVIPLAGKPDGSSYLPEFLEMAENSHPNDGTLTVVQTMIQEEAEAYFAGDKSLEDTVNLIQSRVQLYLDESR